MAHGTGSRTGWLKRARLWVALTAAYNTVEVGVSLYEGFRADSIALIGFGFDAMIELAAALMLLFALRREMSGQGTVEGDGGAHRFVGWTFVALAIYVTVQSVVQLWMASAPEESPLGIGLAVASLIVMPLIAWQKLRAARALESPALRAEAMETLACSYLSVALLAGLGANVLFGWWQADPLAALLMVPWLIKEGREGILGDDD
jgi:divalent metal cation (Fe/Co/Zn/Cd) transporter